MRSLLDVNVLISLLDADHVHHAPAWEWFSREGAMGWASCPITENGCIRVMSQPAYPNPLPTGAVLERLARAARHPLHEFWPDDISLLDGAKVAADRLHGPKQVTDLYLLALAIEHGGRLATFDAGIPLAAVHGARTEHVAVL
jgi:toxin-antitoxin system PIN domain toxin